IESVHKARPQPQRLSITEDRAGEILAEIKDHAQVLVGLRLFWIETQGLPSFRLSLGPLAHKNVEGPQTAMSSSVFLIEPKRFSELSLRLIVFGFANVRRSQVVVDLGIARTETDGFLESLDGPIVVSLEIAQDDAQRSERQCVIAPVAE